jgi:carbonic anhydrase/acetyltransferase-like protein (isoleucine patch superfamily)
MPLYALDGISPLVPPDGQFWVAPCAHVIGKVQIEAGVSIWFGAVLRGDIEEIFVGTRSNIQEGSLLHTDTGFPLTVGPIVPSAIMRFCTAAASAQTVSSAWVQFC